MKMYQLIFILLYFVILTCTIYDCITTYRRNRKYFKEYEVYPYNDGPAELTKAVIGLHIAAIILGIVYLLIEKIDWSFLNQTIY